MTQSLKKLIKNKLLAQCDNVYYNRAQRNPSYPHVIFSFRPIDSNDLNRKDYTVRIDVWDKQEGYNTSADFSAIENLCDDIESMFNYLNEPFENILPTFYAVERRQIDDDNEALLHREITVQVQVYKKGS